MPRCYSNRFDSRGLTRYQVLVGLERRSSVPN
jgi:hypothetical protein